VHALAVDKNGTVPDITAILALTTQAGTIATIATLAVLFH
jgi:hypothetical protein